MNLLNTLWPSHTAPFWVVVHGTVDTPLLYSLFDSFGDSLPALRTELHFEKEEQAKLEKRLVAASKDATQRENSAQQQESARYTALLRQK